MSKTNEFIAGWMGHRKALLEILDVLESNQLQVKPWDKAMSLSELVLHISDSMIMLTNTVKNGVFTPPAEQKTAENIEELRKIVQEATEQTKAELAALTEEQLNQLIDFAGMQMPGSALLEMFKDHEVHHKGQVFTYARIAGVETLPNFISR